MTLFKAKPRPFEGEHTVIGEDVRIKGGLEANGNIRMEGMIEGHIALSGDLMLGEHGKVIGNIEAHNIMIFGKVEGDIKTKGRIEIMTTGQVQGDVTCTALVIDEGGILQGCSTMNVVDKKNPAPLIERQGKKEKEHKQG